MKDMFKNASLFNQPLNNWNVSNVVWLVGLFDGARSFNQPLHDFFQSVNLATDKKNRIGQSDSSRSIRFS